MKACFHLDVENTWRCDQNLPRTRDEDVKWYIDDELNHSLTSLSCKSKQNWRFYYDLHFGKWIRYFEEAHLLEEKKNTQKETNCSNHSLLVLVYLSLDNLQIKMHITKSKNKNNRLTSRDKNQKCYIYTSFNYGII